MATVTIDKDKVAKSALRYIQKGQYSKAVEEYRKVLASDPKDIRLRLKLVDLYGRLGKRKEAVEECLLVAESYSDQGFYLKAVAVYKQAVRIDSENPQLCQSMADLYVKQGLLGDALGCYKKGVQLLRQQGRNDDAERLLSRMAAMAPDSVSVKINLAELYLAEGKLPAFETEIDRIVRQLRDSGRAGMLLHTLAKFQERAVSHPPLVERLREISRGIQAQLAAPSHRSPPEPSRSAVGGDGRVAREGSFGTPASLRIPEDVGAAVLEADLYLKYGLDEKALDLLQELARRVPGELPVHERLRDLCWRTNDRAGWALEQLAIAELHRSRKNGAEAVRALRALLQVEPGNAEGQRALREVDSQRAAWATEGDAGPAALEGQAQTKTLDGASSSQGGERSTPFEEFELTEVDEIVREFKSGIAEKLDAGDHETHYNLGMAYKEMGLLDDALQEFRLAARSPERSREAYTCMAMVFRETQRLADARAALKMALAGCTNTPEDEVAILFELGTVAEEEEDWDGALQAFSRASTIDPEYRDLSQRLKALERRREP